MRRPPLNAVAAIAALLFGITAGLLLSRTAAPSDSSSDAAAPTAAPVAERCDGADAELRVAAAPEIAPALTDIAERADDPALECADVQVTSVEPADVAAALASGGAGASADLPNVWMPRTSTEVELARGAVADAELSLGDAPSVATSPVAVAMPMPMAQQLDWPDGDMTWDRLADMVATPRFWAGRGHPDWGAFRLRLVRGVRAEPSVTAVTSLADAVGVVPGPQTADQTEDERFDAQARLLEAHRAVDYLGGTTSRQLELLIDADDTDTLLRTASAVPLTEQMVWQFNSRDEVATPLAAWYPTDAAPDADYPYATLDGPDTDAGVRDAAVALLRALQSPEGARRLQTDGFRDRERAASDALASVDGIDPQMAPPAGPAPLALVTRTVTATWRDLSVASNLLAVVDVSGSMETEVPGTGQSRLALSAQGIAAGATLLNPAGSAGLWEFSTNLADGTDHREVIEFGPLTARLSTGKTRQQQTVAAVRKLRPRADTGLYDTILASYAQMRDNYDPDRLNGIVFFTDGKNDDDDGLGLGELRQELRSLVDPDRRILFLAVGYGPEADFDVLGSIVDIVGGKLYKLERPDQIRQVFIDAQTGNVS